MLGLLFKQASRRRPEAHAPEVLPPARRPRRGPGPPLRPQDRRHAPRHRAPDQPLRPLQGVQRDDRSDELNQIVVRKAVDFGVAEVGSLWLFESETSDVILAGTAVNENYDVENAPDAVGASIVGDLLVSQKTIRDNNVRPDTPSRPKTRTTGSAPSSLSRSSRTTSRSARSSSSTSAAASRCSRPRTTSCSSIFRARRSGPCATPASTKPRRKSKSWTPSSPSAGRSRRLSTSTRSCRRSSTRAPLSSSTTRARSRSWTRASCVSELFPA